MSSSVSEIEKTLDGIEQVTLDYKEQKRKLKQKNDEIKKYKKILKKEAKLERKKEKKLEKEKIKLSKKEKKEKKNVKLTKKVVDVMNVINIDGDGAIELKNEYMNIFQIMSKDIYSFSESDEQLNFCAFSNFLRTIDTNVKIVPFKFPVNATKQKDYLSNKASYIENDTYRYFLELRYSELCAIEKNRTNMEFYLFSFAKTKEEEFEIRNNILNASNDIFTITNIYNDKKKKILFKLNNLNTKLYEM